MRILRFARIAYTRLLRRLLARRQVDLAWPVTLERGTSFRPGIGRGAQRGRIIAGPRCQFGHGAIVHAHGGHIALGANVFVGPHAVIYGHGGVDIGDDTLISMHCRILSSNHTIPARDTTIRSQPDILLPTRIGRDVWLGAGVTVLGGVSIGDGCVVGAGALVANDLPPYCVAIGVPARVTRQRN